MMSLSDNRIGQLISRKRTVFAYGSLLNRETMQKRCPSAQFKTRAVLPDYTVDFTRWSPQRQGGVLDVIQQCGSTVWGVVYEISSKDLKRLDVFEACDKQNPFTYQRVRLPVYPNGNRTGRPIQAETYVIKTKRPTMPPNPAYAQEILTGAEQSQLPADYIAKLRAFFTSLLPKTGQNMEEAAS